MSMIDVFVFVVLSRVLGRSSSICVVWEVVACCGSCMGIMAERVSSSVSESDVCSSSACGFTGDGGQAVFRICLLVISCASGERCCLNRSMLCMKCSLVGIWKYYSTCRMLLNASFQYIVLGTPLDVYFFMILDVVRCMCEYILLSRGSLSLLTNLQIGRLLVSNTDFRYMISAFLFLILMYVGSPPNIFLYVSASV